MTWGKKAKAKPQLVPSIDWDARLLNEFCGRPVTVSATDGALIVRCESAIATVRQSGPLPGWIAPFAPVDVGALQSVEVVRCGEINGETWRAEYRAEIRGSAGEAMVVASKENPERPSPGSASFRFTLDMTNG